MTRSVALAAALCLAVPVARAQSVMGQVLDSASRRPLAGVPVRLVRAAPDSAALGDSALPAGRTATDGVFTLVAPAPGHYRVRVRDDFDGPVLALASVDAADQHLYVVPADADRVYEPTQVDRRPGLRDGFGTRYPSDLVQRGVAGCTALQVVVGTTGRLEPASLRVLAATHRGFADAALAAAKSARYEPAERRGRRVRSVMRFPVVFSVQGGAQADRTLCVRAAGLDAADAVEVRALGRVMRSAY